MNGNNRKEKIPVGWKWVKLGKICKFVGGTQPPKYTFKTEESPGHIRLIQIQDYRTDKYKIFIREEDSDRRCNVDDIMIARYGGYGDTSSLFRILRGLKGAYNVALIKVVIISTEILDREYLYFALQRGEIRKEIISKSARAIQSGFTKEDLENVEIPLPPLPEQKRIAAILNEQMAAVDRARAAADAQLETAKALPSAYLREIFYGPEAKKWPRKRLKEGSIIIMGQSPPGTSYNLKGIGEPLLNGPTEFGQINPTPTQWTESPTKIAEQGDILLCVRGATTGRKNIADRRYCIGRGLAAIRGKEMQAITEFLWFALDIVTASILEQTSGSTFPNLPGGKLENIEIIFPSVAEQKKIADYLSAQIGKAEVAYKVFGSYLGAINKLPNAFLRKAFSGEI